jgi:hypothetical protein
VYFGGFHGFGFRSRMGTKLLPNAVRFRLYGGALDGFVLRMARAIVMPLGRIDFAAQPRPSLTPQTYLEGHLCQL